jgi:hypothetical protein
MKTCETTSNHERLNRAREALGFNTVAFDYSYDRTGNLVVWEPNPYPVLWNLPYNTRPECDYQRPVIHRLYRELLTFYLKQAQLGEATMAEGLESG